MSERPTSPTSTRSTVSSTSGPMDTQPDHWTASALASPQMSTPPTSVGDEASVLSDTTKPEAHAEGPEDTPATPATPALEAHDTPQPTTEAAADATAPKSEGRRSMRASRAAVTTYNVQILAGTAIHTPTKYLEKHHKNVLHGDLDALRPHSASPKRARAIKVNLDDISDPAEAQLATETAQAAQRRKSSRVDLRKEAFRNLTAAGDALARGPELLSNAKNRMQNSLRGVFADSGSKESVAETEDDDTDQDEKVYLKPKRKHWAPQGLYVGQHREFDARLKEGQNRLRRQSKKVKERESALPMPMFAGERRLNEGQEDYKLPFDIYHPLARKVTPEGWTKLQKNRFIGEASALWKRDKQDSSVCECTPADGCGDRCHNRIMAYECDENNCPLAEDQCTNRPFAELKRRSKMNRYDYGVEVMETGGKGYGVRAMRTFEPNQIIVEYAGEIITQAECERRMKQVYKRDKCYYLMSFDNKMIIDATRGTIARFVNHSCEPNCEMIKWTVGGEPRMALFAGNRGIMTGEELTYDYNFDPFSQKNIQECHCGTESCRGFLGPKPKHNQPREEKSMASSILAGTKRKVAEFFGADSASTSAPNSPKKRKFSYMANVAETKKQNALAEDNAAREKAEKKAVEEAAQQASRENRAMRRSSTMSISASHSKSLPKSSRHSLPAATTSHKTTVDVKHGAPPGTLKPVSKFNRISTILRGKPPVPKAIKRQLPSGAKDPAPAEPSLSRSPSLESDNSPNITPASLRSASRKTQLTQTTLPFKPLQLATPSNLASSSSKPRISAEMEFPDSEDEEEAIEHSERSEEPESEPAAKRPKNSNAGSVRANDNAKKALGKGVRGPSTKRTATGGKTSSKFYPGGAAARLVADDEDD